MKREIIFDTETTGINPANGARLVEIAAVELIDKQPTGRIFHHYINPDISIPPIVSQIHGIDDEMVAGKPKFSDIAHEFLEFIGDDSMLVAHNANFDMKFINAELSGINLPTIESSRIIDTLAIAIKKFPNKHCSLEALRKKFNVDTSNPEYHGALLECDLLAQVYDCLEAPKRAILNTKPKKIYKDKIIDYGTEKSDFWEKANHKYENVNKEYTFALGLSALEHNYITLGSAMRKAIQKAEWSYHADEGLLGHDTGFRALNDKLGGFINTDLICLAGGAHSAKLSLVMQFAVHLAQNYNARILFFSTDTSAQQIANNIIAQHTDIPGDKIHKGEINKEDVESMISSLSDLDNLPFIIDDTPCPTILEIRDRAIYMRRQYGLDMIIINDIEKIDDDWIDDNNHVGVSYGLKCIAVEENIPVIVTTETDVFAEVFTGNEDMSKSVLARLSNEYGFENIVNDADVIMGLHNYDYMKPPERKINESEMKFMERVVQYDEIINETKNTAKIIIAKNANGNTCHVDLFFDGFKFGDIG